MLLLRMPFSYELTPGLPHSFRELGSVIQEGNARRKLVCIFHALQEPCFSLLN